MRRFNWLAMLAALVLALGCLGFGQAEIIPPEEPGQQIGYQAVVLCESLTMREKPRASAKAVRTLSYGDLPIVVGADLPDGPKMENGFVYCSLGDAIDSPVGWLNADYLAINPAWYVTDSETPVYAWSAIDAPRVGLLSKGERLPILKQEAGWYLVSLRGAVGWIFGGK